MRKLDLMRIYSWLRGDCIVVVIRMVLSTQGIASAFRLLSLLLGIFYGDADLGAWWGVISTFCMLGLGF